VAALCLAADPECGHLGGNVANGSPIGDSMPWMIALGSEVVLQGPSGQRVLPLEAFYLDYQKKDMRPTNSSRRARAAAACQCAVPYLQAGQALRPGYLGGVRGVCLHARWRQGGGCAHRLRRHGGHAAPRTPKRRCLAWAGTKPICAWRWMLQQDYAPLSDMRASNTYRMQTAQNLLRRFWLETRADAPLAADAVNAFACRA
jgi:xanthine dehydrogenase small subunit